LYHEATFTQEDAVKARETLHSTAADAATTARMAGVDKLLLGHFSARYKDLTPLLDEARAIFPNSYLATEGEEITITD
jgi:ribonuclease Z